VINYELFQTYNRYASLIATSKEVTIWTPVIIWTYIDRLNPIMYTSAYYKPGEMKTHGKS
jgi:hypothetical protein